MLFVIYCSCQASKLRVVTESAGGIQLAGRHGHLDDQLRKCFYRTGRKLLQMRFTKYKCVCSYLWFACCCL